MSYRRSILLRPLVLLQAGASRLSAPLLLLVILEPRSRRPHRLRLHHRQLRPLQPEAEGGHCQLERVRRIRLQQLG